MHLSITDQHHPFQTINRRMNVLALTRYSALAASTRQRFTQFFPALREAGIDVTLSPLLGDDYVKNIGGKKSISTMMEAYGRRFIELAFQARSYDALWIQYEVFPFLPGPFERVLAMTRRPYLVDYDDAIFHNYDLSGGSFRRWALSRKLVPLLTHAHACVAGNTYLATYAERYCPEVVIIPTVVNTNRYCPLKERLAGPLRVGWIGSPSTWRYVEPLLPTIIPVLQRFGAELNVVGAAPTVQQTGIKFFEWSEDTEIAAVQSFDIGIMPLSDDPWARGKCGYKLIQYMSCGVPCIASPVGVNADIVTPGEDGFLATGAEEWISALTILLSNADLRIRMGESGRSKVISRYSLKSQVDPISSLIGSLKKVRKI
jgi:glycosyltransferase involved in cell wall biosynthesis